MPDCTADVVVSTQVLEHVPDPRAYLLECRRILKPGGMLILTTHGYWEYHPQPTDLWRWTGPGLRKLVEASGFRVLDCTGLLGLASSGLHLFQDRSSSSSSASAPAP
jgi:SAM-dependent methyltransferase